MKSKLNWFKLPSFLFKVVRNVLSRGITARATPKRRKLRVIVPKELVVNGYNLKKWQKFKDVEDPFNPGNTISGYLNRVPNAAYGSLYITHVNGEELDAEQFIWATPKMHYPHDTNQQFHWPRGIDEIRAYAKIDGTNIVQYRYWDNNMKPYTSYKTRMQPFMKGDFVRLWEECLEKYSEIPNMWDYNKMNISYEMYGYRNEHLVHYDVGLDVVVLFGRGADNGVVFPPEELKTGKVPTVERITTITKDSNFTDEYWKIRKELNNKLKITLTDKKKKIIHTSDGTYKRKLVMDELGLGKDDFDEKVEGLEGAVMYAIGSRVDNDGNSLKYVSQLKCKPDFVMDMHIKAAAGVPKHSIMITIKNAFEDMDVVTAEYVVELLKEEFEEQDIYKKLYFIMRAVTEENLRQGLKRKLIKEYLEKNAKDENFDINKDKGTVMRHFAGTFMAENNLDRKKYASKIYTLLNEEFGNADGGERQ